jgi:hypothetical protein
MKNIQAPLIAVPWFTQLLWTLTTDIKPVHVGSVVDKVALELISIIPMLHTPKDTTPPSLSLFHEC